MHTVITTGYSALHRCTVQLHLPTQNHFVSIVLTVLQCNNTFRDENTRARAPFADERGSFLVPMTRVATTMLWMVDAWWMHTGMHTGMRTKAPHLHGGDIPACAADNYDAAQPQGRKQPPAFVR